MNIYFPHYPLIPKQVWKLVLATPLNRNKEVFRHFGGTYLCAHKTENGHQYRTGNNKTYFIK